MKYNVGDKVRVRKDLVNYSEYGGELFVREMQQFKGKVVTICRLLDDKYFIREDTSEYAWTNEMLEGIANDAIKPDYYERSAMQPIEVMQRIMTAEQFEGFLLGNCIKYRMRCENKGQRDSDMHKSRQYAYWLEMTKEGRIINPSEDRVPDSYRFKVV